MKDGAIKGTLKRIPGLRRAVRLLRRQPTRDAREYLLGKMPKRSVCAEIGVHKGQFSRRIMRRVKPKRLHLIDPWRHEEGETYRDSWYGCSEEGQSVMDGRYEGVRKLFDREIGRGRVVIHRASSSEAAGGFDDGYFDWIYIDGNHLYEFVKQDLNYYCPKVKAGGFIAGDDYGLEGWWHNGVQRAVDEFVTQREGMTLKVKEGQFWIQKKF